MPYFNSAALEAPDFSRGRVHYSPDDILNYIQEYGYSSIKAIEEQYGISANQVVAECSFESQQLSEYEFVSAPFPSEDEAEKLLCEIESK